MFIPVSIFSTELSVYTERTVEKYRDQTVVGAGKSQLIGLLLNVM